MKYIYIYPRPSVGVVVTSECTATSSYTEHKLNFLWQTRETLHGCNLMLTAYCTNLPIRVFSLYNN
jgi:hypothetical protein